MGERGPERTLQEGTVKAHNRALMLRVETRTGKRLGAQKHTQHDLEFKEKNLFSYLFSVSNITYTTNTNTPKTKYMPEYYI